MKIEEYFEAAGKSKGKEFLEIARKVFEILKKEEKIIFLPKKGKLIVIGDLHGSYEGIKVAFEDASPKRDYFLFLGDYGDRGDKSPEVYFVLFKLKIDFPNKIFLLRGNHEPPPYLMPYPHELPSQLERKYKSKEPYLALKEIWEELPVGALVKGKYLFLHGGLPVNLKSVKELENRESLEEILWSDPVEIRGVFLSPRGAGRSFGKNLTEDILGKIKIKTLIRSHEVCEGMKTNHQGKILTIFSTKSPPYQNKGAAILKINLEEEIEDAFSLSKKAIFF